MYRVIHYFTDLQDNNQPYKVGDTFPRQGLTVTKERLAELAGKNNKQGKPLIELVPEETPKATPKAPRKRVTKASTK